MNASTVPRSVVFSLLVFVLVAGCGGSSSPAADAGNSGGVVGTGGVSATGGLVATGGTTTGSNLAGDASANVPFYDPVSTDHITNAFALVRQFAAGFFTTPEVRFISVKGDPTGAPGATYDATPLQWTYQFSACDASVQPCANTQLFTLTQPGLTVAGPFTGPASGLSLLETEFRAAVPLDFSQLLAGSAPNQQFCPIGPTALNTQYISLQGGTKSGSGKALWWWNFQCVNVVNGQPVYRQTNGDVIT
jgi:hypothetical protein